MIYIASLTFSPAHQTLMECYYNVLSCYSDVVFIIDSKFIAFKGDYYKNKKHIVFSKTSLLDFRSGDKLLVVSPNLKNNELLKHSSKKGCTNFYVYHEPNLPFFEMIKSVGGFSFNNLKKCFGLRLFNGKKLLKYSDCVIFPSNYSKSICLKSYKVKKYAVIPLMEIKSSSSFTNERNFFGYIGTIAQNHAFDEFIDFLKYSAASNCFRFLIATKTKLDETLKKQLQELLKDRIEIHDGKVLTENEINSFYSRCAAVWCAYNHSTQSGVLISAFTNSTPVLVSELPTFLEVVEEGKTGEFVANRNFYEINLKFNKILNNLDHYIEEIRKYYSLKIDYKNYQDIILKTFNEINH